MRALLGGKTPSGTLLGMMLSLRGFMGIAADSPAKATARARVEPVENFMLDGRCRRLSRKTKTGVNERI